MKIYVMTDSHLGHDKLVHMGQGRPDDFSDQVLRGLTKVSGDLLIHLGDVCIGDDQKWNTRLLANAYGFGKKVLVKGNHDGKSDAWYYKQGWDFVCREFSNKCYGKALVFSHAPIPLEHISGYDHNVHGHYHGSAENSHRHQGTMLGGGTYDHTVHKDAAPELHGYTPIKLENLWS